MSVIAAEFQFEDAAAVLRLSLMTDDGWQLGRGLDIGTAGLEGSEIRGGGQDGGIPSGLSRPNTEMRIPVYLTPQDTWAEMQALYDALIVELERPRNIIRFKPHDDADPYFFDTYRAHQIPSMFRGQDLHPALAGADIEPLVILLKRHPVARGAGAYI